MTTERSTSKIWYTLKDFAKELGMCQNTFKAHYIEQYPPQRVAGLRKYWSQKNVERAKSEILGAN